MKTKYDAHSSRFHPDAHSAFVALLHLERELGNREAVATLFHVKGDTVGNWLSTKIPVNRVREVLEAYNHIKTTKKETP